jgi:hypothetical protein
MRTARRCQPPRADGFDTIKPHNLDHLIGTTATDAWSRRSKIDLARRFAAENATVSSPVIKSFDLNICEPDGLAAALDPDQIICCVDRPWPGPSSISSPTATSPCRVQHGRRTGYIADPAVHATARRAGCRYPAERSTGRGAGSHAD